jgi:hypothetical protein
LEARWAVYFDAMKLRWDYEHEGYTLVNGNRYLPDFWLPELDCFAEVKPFGFTREEFAKASLRPRPCILLDGTPDVIPYFVAGELSHGDSQVISLEDRYRDYLSGISMFRVWLDVSAYKRRLWFDFDDGNSYDRDEAQQYVDMARAARFEEFPR